MKSPFSVRRLSLGVGCFAVLVMLMGALLQVAGNLSWREFGIMIHLGGSWLLWFAFVFLLFGVSRWGQNQELVALRDVEVDLETRTPLATLSKTRLGKVVLIDREFTESMLKELKQVDSVQCLDLRRAKPTAELLMLLEQLTRVAELWLPPLADEMRRLRVLQVSLPACRIYLNSGTRVDFT